MVVKKKQENKSEVSLQTCQTFLLIIFAKIFIVEVTGVWQGCKDNSANYNPIYPISLFVQIEKWDPW